MADAIKGNITVESGSVDKAAASIEALNASLKDSLKSAKALNAELKKTNATKSITKSGTSKSVGGSTAENSLKAANITKMSTAFGTALTNSIKIKDNIIEAGKITTQIKNEFAAMLKKVATANAGTKTNAASATGVSSVTAGGNVGKNAIIGGGNVRKSKAQQMEGVKQANRIQIEGIRQSDRIQLERLRQKHRNEDYQQRQADALLNRARKEIEQREKEQKANAKYERRLADRRADYQQRRDNRLLDDARREINRTADRNARFAQQNAAQQRGQTNRIEVLDRQLAGRIQLEQLRQSHRQANYQQRRDDTLRDRGLREQRGSFRSRYYAERQFDTVRDRFIGHGFGSTLSPLSNAAQMARSKFFDWYINRQTRLRGLDPQSPDFDLQRSAIMHHFENRGAAIMRVVGLAAGSILKVGTLLLKLSIIITKTLAQIHMMGAAIGGLITAIGVATAAQEYDRYRGQMTKLMVSHDMFANNTILPFDEKAKHNYVNANYGLAHYLTNKYAMRGLDTVESGIRLAHLVGVGEGGGFKTDDEAMNFTRGLIAAAQVNGMTDAELSTLQYQGSQIASKGYAELMDIKPLMNSAPGIINDLIKFTGMSREELLKSGKTKALTWEKFKNMFVENRQYYETLASRRDSQTINGQFQAAKQAFGLGVMGVSSSGIAEGGVKDIMQELAGSDLILVLGQMFGKIAGEFVKFFVMMFADESDKSIRGAITNFGLTVINFLGETAHIVVDLIGNVRMMWHTFGETFKSVIRFLADNPITRSILENIFGGELPKWALSDDAESNDKYRVKTRDGREVVFGGDMRTERLLDIMEEHDIAENKKRLMKEISDATKQANVAQGLYAKGKIPKVFANVATRVAQDRVDALRAQHANYKPDRQKLAQRATDIAEDVQNISTIGGYKTILTERGLFNRDLVVNDAETQNLILERAGIRQTKDTIQSQTQQMHGVIDDAVDGAIEMFQTRPDNPENRKTNELLGKIEANTGKGKAALDRVTDVLVEFTKNRVINNITRVRPNVVVNFGDISDTSSINFAMSEMTSKLKHAIENVAGEDTVTLQIGGING